MILNIFISLILMVLNPILGLITSVIPTIDLLETLITTTETILNISQQGMNFVHFIVGDSIVIILPATLLMLTYKYLIFPIIDFARKCIPFINL